MAEVYFIPGTLNVLLLRILGVFRCSEYSEYSQYQRCLPLVCRRRNVPSALRRVNLFRCFVLVYYIVTDCCCSLVVRIHGEVRAEYASLGL